MGKRDVPWRRGEGRDASRRKGFVPRSEVCIVKDCLGDCTKQKVVVPCDDKEELGSREANPKENIRII